ncbi:unnamed protein product [Bursaphelenchus xylophilus]|uniref:(pine wood nematode) hypothetical protein n=1 Tax=Bursaphelenchus xylophilus TaxID=6326 RepID=A0A1I7SWK9_BURXY|nr:unnamed protein product [Bursaphelenchus xylophilus]CAG9099602.1 unnamed protein product [Bursaphelenchus xylophilus]
MLCLASFLWNWMSGLIYVTILLFLHSSLYICCSKDRNRCQKQGKTGQLDRVGPHGDIACNKGSWRYETSLAEDEINKEKRTDDTRTALAIASQSSLDDKVEEFEECETQRTESTAKDVDEEVIALEFDQKQKQAVIESLHRFLDISKNSKGPLQVRCNTNAQNIILHVRKVKR